MGMSDVRDSTEAGQPADAECRCLACDTPIIGPYCHACGQKDDDCRRSIISLAAEVVRDTAAIDGRFARTCRESLIKPGGHLRQYAHGRRSPFTPPVRYFFVILFVFFAALWATDRNILVVQLIPEAPEDAQPDGQIRVAMGDAFDDALQEAVDELELEVTEEVRAQLDDAEVVDDIPLEVRERLDATKLAELEAVALEDASRPRIIPYGGFFVKARDLTYTDEEKEWIRERMSFNGEVQFFDQTMSSQRIGEALLFTMQNPSAFNNALNEAIPILLLLFVPLMAILGAVFIRGPDALIYDHLLLSIQTHAFAFVVLIFTLATASFLPGEVGGLLFLIGVPAYYLISAKGAFGRSWRKTTAATLFIGMIYNSLFFIGLFTAVVFAFLEIS